jgi:hypothetical protein
MNDKIKELAARARVLTDWGDDITVGRWGISGNYERMQKFAELIVRECLSIVDDAERGGSNEIWNNAVKFIRQDLQEHFGVKE